MAREGLWWDDHLDPVLSTKPAEVVQEACQVMEKHGLLVKKELKSELYYSSTLCSLVLYLYLYLLADAILAD